MRIAETSISNLSHKNSRDDLRPPVVLRNLPKKIQRAALKPPCDFKKLSKTPTDGGQKKLIWTGGGTWACTGAGWPRSPRQGLARSAGTTSSVFSLAHQTRFWDGPLLGWPTYFGMAHSILLNTLPSIQARAGPASFFFFVFFLGGGGGKTKKAPRHLAR